MSQTLKNRAKAGTLISFPTEQHNDAVTSCSQSTRMSNLSTQTTLVNTQECFSENTLTVAATKLAEKSAKKEVDKRNLLKELINKSTSKLTNEEIKKIVSLINRKVDPDIDVKDLPISVICSPNLRIGQPLDADIQKKIKESKKSNRPNTTSDQNIKQEKSEKSCGAQVQVIDGKVVLVEKEEESADSKFLNYDRSKCIEEDANDQYRYYNCQTLLKKAKVKKWSKEETELFYKGLRIYGTDFSMIKAKVLPHKTRDSIKLKFNRESKISPARVDFTMIGKQEDEPKTI